MSTNERFAELFAEAGSPAVGRIVHYQARGSADGVFKPEPRAAIITAIGGMSRQDGGPDGWQLTVSLAVLNPTGLFFDEKVMYSPTPKPGSWSWPPRI